MKPMTKYAKQVVNGNNIPSMVREAFKIATTERPGAVHIELPEDIAAEEVEDNIYPVQTFRYPNADKIAIADAVKMIEKAKRPLLCIGGGANRTKIGDALTNFVNETGIPFFSTQIRITSYNVCYTKLLRKDEFFDVAALALCATRKNYEKFITLDSFKQLITHVTLKEVKNLEDLHQFQHCLVEAIKHDTKKSHLEELHSAFIV